MPKQTLAWSGGVKPKKPTEGFATSVKVQTSSSGPRSSAAQGQGVREIGRTVLREGPSLEVKQLSGERPETRIRPGGRFKLP